MKRMLFFSISVLLLASCTSQKPLYTWNNYEITSYNYLKNSDEKSIQELIENYQRVIEEQKGTRGVVPPGIYADYGFILLQISRTEEGKEMLLNEISLYPESNIFIQNILRLLD